MRIYPLKSLPETTVEEIVKGRIFCYPTDTVYGLGCNALISKSVKKLRRIKQASHPFSVIAPSKDWIEKNMHVPNLAFLGKLPGPITLIFRKRNSSFLKECSQETLGIRIPDHMISEMIAKAGVPFVSTSANLAGERTIRKLSELPAALAKGVDIGIDAGRIDNLPSQVYDMTDESPKRIR